MLPFQRRAWYGGDFNEWSRAEAVCGVVAGAVWDEPAFLTARAVLLGAGAAALGWAARWILAAAVTRFELAQSRGFCFGGADRERSGWRFDGNLEQRARSRGGGQQPAAEVVEDLLKDRLIRTALSQREPNAADTHADDGADLQQLEADRVAPRGGQRRLF